MEDAELVLDALRADSAALLGISAGGPFAAACAAGIPGCVRRLVLVSPLGLPGWPTCGMAPGERLSVGVARRAPAFGGWFLGRLAALARRSPRLFLRVATSELPGVDHRALEQPGMRQAFLTAARALPLRVPLVASEHNQMSWPGGDHTSHARHAARRVDLFFAHGPAVWRWAAGLGLDDGRLRPGRSLVEGLSARPLPGLPTPRLTFAGRFREDKARDVLVEALALLGAPPAYLLGDGPHRDALIALIRARGLQAVVHLPGWSYQPARYIVGASVHVVPSGDESWSQSAVLGLLLGVPVVGAAVDVLAATLAAGRGVLVPPEDPRSLARALSRELTGERPDPGPGRAYARQFTPRAAAAAHATAYRQLLARRSNRGRASAAPP